MNWKSEIKKKDSVRRIEPAISPDYMRELMDINNYLDSLLEKTFTNERIAAFPEEEKKYFQKARELLGDALDLLSDIEESQNARNAYRAMTRTTQRKSPRMGVEGGTKGRGSKRYGKDNTFRGQ